MEVLPYVLSLISASVAASQWIDLRAALAHFRGAATGPCRTPMTLIRPVRGLDDALAENLSSLAEADPRKTLQIIVAMESSDDPAHPVVEAFRAAHPDRDILLLLTGPAGRRTGVMHNKIEALKKAKHPFVLFSDADAAVSRGLLAEAERAFLAGAPAVCAAAFHAAPRREGDWWFLIVHNHGYSASAASRYRDGGPPNCFGTFMGFTRETLERAGGLESFSRCLADDAVLGVAIHRLGLRQELLRAPVFVREHGSSVSAAFTRLARWAALAFWASPFAWLMSVFLNASVLACAAGGFALAQGRGLGAAAAALAFALFTRVAVAAVQDRALAYRLPLTGYARLLFADAALIAAWPFAVRRTYDFRGRRYRLGFGWRLEAVE